MTFNSLAPMRRNRISSRPASVSKDHCPSFLMSGIGSGQSSLPTDRIARLEFLGSTVIRFFSRAFAANMAAMFLSRTGSSEDTRSSPAGPRISFRAGRSKISVAWINASEACFGVANAFGAGCDRADAFCTDCFAALESVAAVQNSPISKRNPGIIVSKVVATLFMCFSLIMFDYLRRPPPPPREPPREPPPILEEPRELLARAPPPPLEAPPRAPPPLLELPLAPDDTLRLP